MRDFTRSFVTWTTKAIKKHPYYRYDGGFTGTYGDAYRVRMKVDATCRVDAGNGTSHEYFLMYPCRSEYTIATENFFQIPSSEWRTVFSATDHVAIARRPSTEPESRPRRRWRDDYADLTWDLREHPSARELRDGTSVVHATEGNQLINGVTTYVDTGTGLKVTVEFPIQLMNLDPANGLFQLCCGPVILPDLQTWDGEGVARMFLAEVAWSQFDYAEFILRREIEAAESERAWFDVVRGRDRLELWDPKNPPPTAQTLGRRNPSVYWEQWNLKAENVVLATP